MTSDADLSYKVTGGDGSVWKSDAASGLKISANGEHGKFSYIMIDGKLIEPSEYTVSGSRTDAALSADLLKSLGEGEHTIMIVYDDGGHRLPSLLSEIIKIPKTSIMTQRTAIIMQKTGAVLKALDFSTQKTARRRSVMPERTTSRYARCFYCSHLSVS